MVLAIASPTTGFVLAESNRRRCSFLLEAIRVLELRNVRVVQGDVEALPHEPRYPVVVSRAFRPPSAFLAIAIRLVAEGGRVVLLMADPSKDDLAALEKESGMLFEGCTRLRLPRGNEARAIVSFRAV